MMITHRIENSVVQLPDLLRALDIDQLFGLLLVLLVAAFIVLLLYIGRLVSKNKLKRRAILEQLFGFRRGRLSFSKFGLALSFYQIFLMLCKMLYSNSIKTSSTVLETGHFINSLQQLHRSDYVVCFFDNHISLEITVESEQNTVVDRIFRTKSALPSGVNSKRFPNQCVIDLSRLDFQIDLKGKALYANPIYSKLTTSIYAKDGDWMNYWMSPPIFGFLAVNYYRVGLHPRHIGRINKL